MFKPSRSAVSCGLVLVMLTEPAVAWYNAQQGRFLQRDPNEAGQPINEQPVYHGQPPVVRTTPFSPDGHYRDGMNLYQYLRSSPPNSHDPMGLFFLLDLLSSTSTRMYANLAVASAAGAAGVFVSDILTGISFRNAAIDAACFGAAAYMGGSVGLGLADALFESSGYLVLRSAAYATGAEAATGGLVVGLYGSVPRAVLLELAGAGGGMTPVITSLTSRPAVGRALSVALAEGSTALAQAASGPGRRLFTADIPMGLLMKLEEIGLAFRSTTSMNGVQGVEIRFLAGASEFIVPFFH